MVRLRDAEHLADHRDRELEREFGHHIDLTLK